MAQFEIVSDDLRAPIEGARGRGRKSPMTIALMAGQTVLLPPGTKNPGGATSTMRRAGLRLRQMQRPEGLVLWTEPIETPTETPGE